MAGRKRKYHTIEELKESNRLNAIRFYEKHKDRVKKQNLEKYYENKIKKE